ncbi:MAG: Coenzyme F420 hydrogenase/dehydrogenase, beta subunit C-terminal domain [Thermodesulfobacteriota bacterium]
MIESSPDYGGGPKDLAREVIQKDRCAVCGACVGLCPYFIQAEGRVRPRDLCNLDQGRCWAFCPMAGARRAFEGELGGHREIFIAQSTQRDFRRKGQYGGVVSTLVWTALNQGLVKEAVLTGGDPENAPRGVRVSDRRSILAAAGSRYAASGAVAVLNQALTEDKNRDLALVGTPCQIKAAAAMRAAEGPAMGFDPHRIKVLIGLFCTWALDHRRLNEYLRTMLFGERAVAYDIPPPPADVFQVFTSDGIKAFPLDEIRPLRLNACRFCDDMTSVRADVSVGSVEGLSGWNTVIVRTDVGERLIESALARKLLRTGVLPEMDLDHLKEAAALKKERGLSALAQNMEQPSQ